MLTNEYECPLLTLTNTLTGINPADIVTEISVMHECTDSCKFVDNGPLNVLQIERENIRTNRLMYVHDWTNKWYCLNIYCMHK